ncbi:hypothetical protein FRB90_000962 [Tulasnella sp. 427]|nr:hypothetical protein FRB90_000962 [Tulasnella sp. 427]
MPQKKSSHRAKNLGPFAVKKYRQTDEERERWKRAQERRRQADREISESLDESATVSEIGSMEEEPIILPHRTRSGQLLDLRDMAPNPLTARVRALNPTPSSNDDLPDLDESHSLASAELEELTGGYDINQPMSSVDPGTEHSTRLPWRPYREPPSGKKPPRAGRPRWRSFSTIIDGQQGTYRLGDEYRHRAFGSYGDVRKTVAWFEGSIEVQVALKTLRHFIVEDPSRPEMSRTAEKIKKRLRKEVKIWMALRHPNIAPLLGYREDIELCMISPWYENGNIKEYLQRTSPGTQEKLLLVSQIASGVNYLHTSSPVLVHGDLKPASIMN